MRSSALDLKSIFGRIKTATFMTVWLAFSIVSLFIAKHVLHVYQLNETIFTLWQFALSVLFGVSFTKVFGLHNLTTLNNAQLRSIVPLSATFLIKEILKYAALSRVSVNLVNTIRSLGPMFNVGLEFIYLGHRPHRRVLIALVPIVIGVTLTSMDEIHVASVTDSFLVTILGFLAAILSTAINIGQNIYSKILFGREKIDPVSLQIYLSGISFVLMFPFTFTQLALKSVQHGRIAHELVIPSQAVVMALCFAGLINFVASQMAFSTLRLVSPLSYSVANTFKRVAIAVIAIFYFNERLSLINASGIIISIAGIFIYERQSRSQKDARQYRGVVPDESRIGGGGVDVDEPRGRASGLKRSDSRFDMKGDRHGYERPMYVEVGGKLTQVKQLAEGGAGAGPT